jgi:hypothetical protein
VTVYEWYLKNFGFKKIAEGKYEQMIQKLMRYDLSYYPLLEVFLLLLGLGTHPSVNDLQGNFFYPINPRSKCS